MALAVIAIINFMMNLDDTLRGLFANQKIHFRYAVPIEICYFWGENYMHFKDFTP